METMVFYTPQAPGLAVLPNLSYAIAQPLQPPKAKVVTIGEAIEELIIAKSEANRRKRYIKELRSALRLFARDRMSDPVDSFTADDITRFFRSRNYCPSGMQAFTGRLGSLFGFCVRRGWIEKNPCLTLEKPTIERKPVNVLTVEQCETLLFYCRDKKPNALAYLVLCLLAGVRPVEAQQLTWDNVSADCKTVTVPAHISKVRRERKVELMPSAVAWMELAKRKGARMGVCEITRCNWVRSMRNVLRLNSWGKDALRHSAATYWLAVENNPMRVALMLGNGVVILQRHYTGLVTKAEAERFWLVLP